MSYRAEYSGGHRVELRAKTERSAKSEATKALSHGNSVVLFEGNQPIFKREFWSALNRFGWRDWKRVN